MLIGEIEGEVSTGGFTFEAYKEVRKFDFVTVKNPRDGSEWVLCQVDEVRKHPDGKTECDAVIIGYREDGMLKQPRHVIPPDAMVYLADEDVIADTLGLTQDGLQMGRLETNPDIRIFVDPEELYKHLAVLAKTGAGKSYAMSVMIEELLEANYPVIIVDPHGEYHTLQRENADLDAEDEEAYGITPKGYPVREFSTNTAVNADAEELSFASTNLGAKEIGQMVPTNLTNAQLEVLYNTLKNLDEDQRYTLQDVIDGAMNQDSKAKWNLVNILEVVQDSNIFSEDPTPLDDLVRPGEASIINLKGVDPEQQEIIVYKLAKELFEQRKVGELQPFFMVFEEAHNFVPERNFGKAVCSDILRTIASEGRKFGLGLAVVSQRPARVDKNILSQCNTQLILRVTNPNDLNAISRSFEGVTSEVRDHITTLPPGTGLILGKEYPVMTDIRTRRSLHGGETSELSEDTDLDSPEEPVQKEDEEPVAGTGPKPGLHPEETEERTEPTDQPDPAEPAITPEMAADTPAEPDEEPDGPVVERIGEDGIHVIEPVLDAEELDADTVKVAYYPLYRVKTVEGAVAVDGTDGEVKAEADPFTSLEERVVERLRMREATRGQLVEELDAGMADLENAIDALKARDIVLEEADTLRFVGDVFTRGAEQVEPNGSTVIDRSVDAEEAEQIAAARRDTPERNELVYYPYYTAGNRVFDAVTGEEI